MKISQNVKWKYLKMWNENILNVKQDTSSSENSSQTVEIRNKTNKTKQCQKQNIFNNKLERSDQKANNYTSAEMKISQNVKWKYLKMWNKILLQKWIILKQLKSETKQMKESNVKNKTYLEIN